MAILPRGYSLLNKLMKKMDCKYNEVNLCWYMILSIKKYNSPGILHLGRHRKEKNDRLFQSKLAPWLSLTFTLSQSKGIRAI